MPKRSSKPDVNEIAFQGVQSLIDKLDAQPPEKASAPEKEKNPAAVALGRLGGLKGGKARAAKLTSKRRSEIAKKAASTRWNKSN